MNPMMQDLYRGDPLMRNNDWSPENDFEYPIIASSACNVDGRWSMITVEWNTSSRTTS